MKPKNKDLNVVYNRRARKKAKLKKRGEKLLERLYRHPPKNMSEAELKLAHIRIASAIYLPYNWSEEQYKRAEVSLRNMEQKFFDNRYTEYSPELEALLARLWQDLDTTRATVAEQAQAVTSLLYMLSARLENQYGDEQPPIPQSLIFALCCDRNTHPEWVLNAIVELLTQKFSAREAIQISNMLYEALTHPCRYGSDVTLLTHEP